MFLGEYDYQMDKKGRIILPKKIRSQLGKKIIIAEGIGGCLCGYQLNEFKKLTEKITDEKRNVIRLISASAREVRIDKLGRVVIPPNLRESASLESDIVILGVIDRIEIWDRKSWTLVKGEKKIIKEAEQIIRQKG